MAYVNSNDTGYPGSYDEYATREFDMLHMRHSYENNSPYSSGDRILLCSEFAEVLEDNGIRLPSCNDNRFRFKNGYIMIGWNYCYFLYYSTRHEYVDICHESYDSRMEAYELCISRMTGQDKAIW